MLVTYSDMMAKFWRRVSDCHRPHIVTVFRVTSKKRGAKGKEKEEQEKAEKAHNSAYLIKIQRIDIQRIKRILGRKLALSPFPHLARAKVSGRIDIAGFPLARLVFLQRPALSLRLLVHDEFLAVGHSFAVGSRLSVRPGL